MLIAASVGGGDRCPTSGRTSRSIAERLFFVGDPKQSIYRFRRADIGLFLDARDRFADEAVRLTTNFRTVPPLVAWVNDVFGGLMAEERPGAAAAATSRSPRTVPTVPAGHRVQLLGRPHAKDEELAGRRAARARGRDRGRRGRRDPRRRPTRGRSRTTTTAGGRRAPRTSRSCCRPARRSPR